MCKTFTILTITCCLALAYGKQYWGPGNADDYKENKAIKPFTVSYTKEIEDLKADLSKSLKNLPAPLEGTKGFERGFNSNQLKTLVEFWRDDYLQRWDERQAFLNSFPQFKTEIDGLQVHFIHVKPKLRKKEQKSVTVLPLLLLHGWPSSVRDFYETIPMLTTPNNQTQYAFEVVIPSLPGFGWSQGASKQGLGAPAMAVIFKKLMTRLGHEKFMIQGGDWGGLITSVMAAAFPQNVIGAHSSICRVFTPKSFIKGFIASLVPNYFLTPEQIPFHFPLKEKLVTVIQETGFFHIHATKPDTMGIMLTDNPVGLLAYILEKFSTWTNPSYKYLADGGLEKRFSLDGLLDNIMIYYLSNSITTSARIYYESLNKPETNVSRVSEFSGGITVPYGCARFRYDLVLHQMDWQLKDQFKNLVHSSYIQEGGHFATMEIPDVFYNDFIDFVEKVFSSAEPVSTRAPDALYNNFIGLLEKMFNTFLGEQQNLGAFGIPETIYNRFVSSVQSVFAFVAGEL